MGLNCHLNLIGSEVLDRVGHSGIAVEVRYHELFWKPVGRDLL